MIPTRPRVDCPELPRNVAAARVHRRGSREFFAVCSDSERALFSTFLMTSFREQEVVYLFWTDLRLNLHTARVTAEGAYGFSPKR